MDYTGRPVLIIKKSNLVEEHMQVRIRLPIHQRHHHHHHPINHSGPFLFPARYRSLTIVCHVMPVLQEFEVTYDFNQITILLEPIYLIIFFATLLFATIFLNRVDFTINGGATEKVKQQ